MCNNEKIIKKTTFQKEEWNKIEKAMEEEGFRNFHNYILHCVHTRTERSNAERRRIFRIQAKHSELFTIFNKMNDGIEVEKNMEAFMKGANELCQELR